MTEVRATGVLIREATEADIEACGREPAPAGELLVVAESFAEIGGERWTNGGPLSWATMPSDRDASLELLALAEEAREDDVLATVRIAGFGISRWELRSAPHRIELEPGLRDRLAPLRRG